MKFLSMLRAGAAAGTLVFPSLGRAELPEARPSADEVRALRQMVEKQGQQIDELRRALEELTKVVQFKEGATPPAPVPAPAAPAGPLVAPAFPPGPAPAEAAPPPAPAEPRVERAESVSTQHTVEKGETLTSIAKHYNISITDLHKANKITDDRKLQIGQVLRIPTPSPSATPTEKKETH